MDLTTDEGVLGTSELSQAVECRNGGGNGATEILVADVDGSDDPIKASLPALHSRPGARHRGGIPGPSQLLTPLRLHVCHSDRLGGW